MIDYNTKSYPAHLLDIKREIATGYPDFEARITRAWKEIIEELAVVTAQIYTGGQEYIPQVRFDDLETLSAEQVDTIKRRGCVVVKDIVDDEKAVGWRESLREFARVNPDVDGFPANNKQLFELYWTKPQVEARAHPNLLKATTWLNNLYHDRSGKATDVDLNVPLSYADRFRIRRAGSDWSSLPLAPHVDGGTIERWQDPAFRKCFDDILSGNWRQHDPYDLPGRLEARSSMYGRPNQASIFRSFQGWLSMSETGPNEGTLQLFPDVLLSNAYLILRPFFKPVPETCVPEGSPETLKPENWTLDLKSPDFPGIVPAGGGFIGPLPRPHSHPHLALEKTMVSVPTVRPGDAVFWHCDLIHAVEDIHKGAEDSAVMYIPAVPFTAQNFDYVKRQRECFLKGERPPDFPKGKAEDSLIGVATAEDIDNDVGRRAMGFAVTVA
ncbi:hypothetical protein D9756_001184 [Leucocoprinus leucothites]|uniref:DUF1479-domain-containing protein n=1 Tax=Leucocoprinus leucothites TaxID=201217 RepID=A0A8H5LHU7_9AGAR|nr:hypothetical protein D9756_001184 [Leucoagaricus leucothites]